VLAALALPAPGLGATGPARHRVDRRVFTGEGCSARTAVPPVTYDLGSSFAGLGESPIRPYCYPAPKNRKRIWSGPVVSRASLGVSYGSCDYSEGPCTPPLQLQDWAQCARNPRSYQPNPWIRIKTEQEREEASGIWDLRVRLPGAPWVPVFDLEAGRRFELFAGNTTVVVYANEPAMGRRAARALAGVIARYNPRSRRGVLEKALRYPGDGSACRTFRGAL